MSGRAAKSDYVAQNCAPSAARVPFYDWTFHPDNKWWTFDKGHGKTNTRFGRFQDRQFVTGWQVRGFLPLAALVAACTRLRFDAIYAGNPATPAPATGSITNVSSVVTVAAAAVASAGASKMHPIYRCCCVTAAHCFIARAWVTIVGKFSNRARAHRIIYCIMYQILPSCSNLLHLGCGCSTG